MFKNLLLFRIDCVWPLSAIDLSDAVERELFAPCAATQAKATGWEPPREANGALVESVDGQIIARFVIETKAVPADAVRKRVDELADAIEQTTGRKPGKRERKDLREDAMQELLPHAFPKRTACTVWIDPESRLLAIDASSIGKADEITSSLTRVAPKGFGLRLIQTQATPQSAMANWLLDAGALPDSLMLGRSCVLQASGEQPARVKFDKHDLSTDEVRQHLADGKMPVSLALQWQDSVRFTLTDSLQLKGIAFDDSVFADTGDPDADRFDTDVTIKTAELRGMLSDLLAALGGELIPGALPA